jgi:putative transposase
MDKGPEFIAKITLVWREVNRIGFNYIQPGKPTQNVFIKRFYGSYSSGSKMSLLLSKNTISGNKQNHGYRITTPKSPTNFLEESRRYNRPNLMPLGASPRRIKNDNFFKILNN